MKFLIHLSRLCLGLVVVLSQSGYFLSRDAEILLDRPQFVFQLIVFLSQHSYFLPVLLLNLLDYSNHLFSERTDGSLAS